MTPDPVARTIALAAYARATGLTGPVALRLAEQLTLDRPQLDTITDIAPALAYIEAEAVYRTQE